jgi:hypothetical protein
MRIAFLALLAFLPQDLERRRDELAARLEGLRGLKFKTPLKMREGSRREYAAFTLENAKRVYGQDLGAAEKGLKAMGLIPSKLRLELALTLHAGFSVKVFCAGGEVVLLDPQAGDEWILNKMDLGLVDQHFVPPAAATLDAQLAFAALRMGDAEVVKHRIWHPEKLPADAVRKLAEEVEKWEREDSKLASTVVPRLFVRVGEFAWRRGGVLGLTLYQEGGWARLDRAYADPPVSTEQVLHPEKYLKAEKPRAVDPAAVEALLAEKGYTPVYRTVMGELGAALVLETHLPKEDLSSASEGWGGDTFSVFEKEGAPPLVVWATDWDSEPDAVDFCAQAVKVGIKLTPENAGLTAPVLRKGTSVAFAVNVPREFEKDLLEAAWKGIKRVY